jgi:phytoene desaturase
MARPKIIIIGGGLAGLSTGCYALANGWDVTVAEHNVALGGVCTAWRRGPYTIDGCIHWLTGGPFARIYEELRIVPPVEIRPLKQFATVRSAREGWSVTVGSDLEALRRDLRSMAPADGEEIDRLVAAATHFADISPGIDQPPELSSPLDRLRSMWAMRDQLGALVHFHGSLDAWSHARIKSPALREVLTNIVPPEAPALFVLMILGYLARGWLSRPSGGTGPFRDALIDRYRALGGEALLDATVEEIIVEHDQARGVRLTDGTILRGDLVVSTSSAPETVLRLLGGRHGADALRQRLARWKLFDPIVLASWGVARDLHEVPPTLVVTGVDAPPLAGRAVDRLYARVYNDDPSFAPPGHTVVQLMQATDYEWWATRGRDYGAVKAEVADQMRELLAAHVPGLREDVRMTDVATPLTFWRHSRSWRGAFEGWMPSADNFTHHVPKTLPGLGGLYLAGQWVEPGGGVPTALMSGRQLVQILCAEAGRSFVTSP